MKRLATSLLSVVLMFFAIAYGTKYAVQLHDPMIHYRRVRW